MPSKESSSLDSVTALDAFGTIKEATDDYVVRNKMDTYCKEFLPRSDELAIAIFCNAFEELGHPIRSATAGTKVERIKPIPGRERLIDYMYAALEHVGVVEINDEEVTRTMFPCPSNNIAEILENLLDDRPAQDAELRLMEVTGSVFAKCLSGKADALQILFGSNESRTLMSNFYARSALFSTVLQ